MLSIKETLTNYMGNSKIIIAIVVSIIVVKLVAVHFYLKTKIKHDQANHKESDNSNDK